MKSKFWKNPSQTLAFSIIIPLYVLITVLPPVLISTKGKEIWFLVFWLSLFISIDILIVLYALFNKKTFYKIILSEESIECTRFGKSFCKFKWGDITEKELKNGPERFSRYLALTCKEHEFEIEIRSKAYFAFMSLCPDLNINSMLENDNQLEWVRIKYNSKKKEIEDEKKDL